MKFLKKIFKKGSPEASQNSTTAPEKVEASKEVESVEKAEVAKEQSETTSPQPAATNDNPPTPAEPAVTEQSVEEPTPAPQTSADEKQPAEEEQTITYYSEDGTPNEVPRDEFAATILPGIFAKARDNADHLYQSIMMAIQDGFNAECLEPAKHLYEIDTHRERATTTLGVAYLANNKPADAIQLYNKFIEENGPTAPILSNLAKGYAMQGDGMKAHQLLWKAINMNPNLNNAVMWYVSNARENGGEQAMINALHKIADLENSWFAELILARFDLQAGNKDEAIKRYQKALPVANGNDEALLMVSGELGNSGNAADVIDLIKPIYQPKKNSVEVGLNLLRSCLETGNSELGLELVNELKKLNRPDISQQLTFLEEQFNNKGTSAAPAPANIKVEQFNTAKNPLEEKLLELYEQKISSEDFLNFFLNADVCVAVDNSVSEEDLKSGNLKELPPLFSLSNSQQQQLLCFYTDPSRLAPTNAQYPQFRNVLIVKGGEFLAHLDGEFGVVINPFWDKSIRWSPEQAGMIRSMIRKSAAQQ